MRAARNSRITFGHSAPSSCSTIFVRIHFTVRMSPAMAAGVCDRFWEMADIVALIDVREDFRSGAVLVGAD